MLCGVLQLLDFSLSMKAWRSVHFLGHFLMLAIILVSMVNPPRRPRKKDAVNASQEGTPPIKTGLFLCNPLVLMPTHYPCLYHPGRYHDDASD